MVGEEKNGTITITINTNSLHFRRDADFWFETTFTLPAGTDPKQLRTTITKAAPGQESSIGKMVVAIYKIEDGTLTLAENDTSDKPPESFSSAGSVFSLKKVEKKNTETSKTN